MRQNAHQLKLHYISREGAVRRIRTRIGLLAQPESMQSIVAATQ